MEIQGRCRGTKLSFSPSLRSSSKRSSASASRAIRSSSMSIAGRGGTMGVGGVVGPDGEAEAIIEAADRPKGVCGERGQAVTVCTAVAMGGAWSMDRSSSSGEGPSMTSSCTGDAGEMQGRCSGCWGDAEEKHTDLHLRRE